MDGSMGWRTVIGILAGIITLLSILPYIRDILRGLTRPNLVTWWLWTLNGGILAFAQYTAGASWTLAVVVAATIATAMVAVLAVPFGQRDYGLIDAVCLVMALAALAGWWWTKDPLTAIVLGIVAEIFAVSPTIAKTYRAPETETPSTFWLTGFATILSMIASTKFDLANLLFPIYFIAVNTLIAVMATRGRRRMQRRLADEAKGD
jgi:uncharacterized protein with PQ loop repeat